MSAALAHFMGDQHCPSCSAVYDPVTGCCPGCDPGLFRVSAFSGEWLEHSEDKPPDAPVAVVSGRNVPDQVRRFLDDSDLIIVQRLREDGR